MNVSRRFDPPMNVGVARRAEKRRRCADAEHPAFHAGRTIPESPSIASSGWPASRAVGTSGMGKRRRARGVRDQREAHLPELDR